MEHLTRVSDVLADTDMPNPTVPVPFESFASLKQSDDMLVRAAFWAFYAAWLNDKMGKGAAASLAVEARHDGHQIRAITQTLAIRDCVLIQRGDVDRLTRLAQQAPTTLEAFAYQCGWFLCGVALTLIAVWLLWV